MFDMAGIKVIYKTNALLVKLTQTDNLRMEQHTN